MKKLLLSIVVLGISLTALSKVVVIKNKSLIKKLEKQVELELESAYLYEARAHYSEDQGYKGAASWFKKQAQEEREHADKVLAHLRDADVKIKRLPQLKATSTEFKDLKECFTSALEREEKLSSHIKESLHVARENKEDYTEVLMNEFMIEQIEEEKLFKDHIQTLDLYMKKGDITGFDAYLGKRKK